jgi:hypothetical protein
LIANFNENLTVFFICGAEADNIARLGDNDVLHPRKFRSTDTEPHVGLESHPEGVQHMVPVFRKSGGQVDGIVANAL